MISKQFSFLKRRLLKNNLFFHHKLKKLHEERLYGSDRILEIQQEKLINTIKYAYNKSPFYRNLYDRYDVNLKQVQNTGDLGILPIVTKNMVRKNTSDILTSSPIFCTKGFTSGTSGNPLMVYRDYYSTITEEAYLWRNRIENGHTLGERSVSLRGDLNNNIFKVKDTFSNTLYLSSYQLKRKAISRYYEEIIKFKPKAIFAYPSSVEILANFLLEEGLQLDIPFVFTSSETLYSFQRHKIESAFNSTVIDRYGNAERTILIEQDANGTYNEVPTYSVNEYEKDRTICTSLINNTFPLIRYEVNDTIETGHTRGVIITIQGRSDDVVILPDGTKIGRLGVPLKGLDYIKLAQLVQNEVSELNVNIVPYSKLDQDKFNQIKTKLVSYLGNDIRININEVTENIIKKSASGKFKLVINNINNK